MSKLALDQLLDGKYRIVRLVGQGAWATVYEAINVRIQRRVAIKILNIELATQPELHGRFAREAEAATQIDSPFVVAVFDAGTLDDGRPYIVMEFLEGEDLGKRLRRLGRIPEETAASYAIHLLSGLADAHGTGILHRDIKPDNLVIVKSKQGEEVLKLVDFGISKPSVARPEMLAMTRADSVLGSPVYMSPEQARGTRHMDHRSDLYSVGVVLYEVLTSELPHDADNFNELMFKVALEDAPDPRTKKPDLDPGLAEIVVKALSREPSARFQSAIEFRDALVAWGANRGVSAPSNPYVITSKIRVRAAGATDTPIHELATVPPEGTEATANPQTSSSVRNSLPRLPSDPSIGSTAGLSSTTGSGALTAHQSRNKIVIAIGAVLMTLMGIGVGLAMTRERPHAAEPRRSASVAAPTATDVKTTTTTAMTAPEASTPPSASAETSTVAVSTTAAPSGPVPAGARRPLRPPVTSASVPSPSAVATAAPTSSAVVEGRTIRTTF